MSDRDEPVAAGGEGGDLTELQRRVASLAPSLRVRLEERPLTRRAATPADTRIPLRAAGERCPLSLTQQRLWFLNQLLPGSAAYNEPTALRLEGGLDSASLSRALDEIVARHEALRTVFAAAAGEPYQVVQPPRSLDLERLDCPRSRAPHARRRSRRRGRRRRCGLSTCARTGRSGRG